MYDLILHGRSIFTAGVSVPFPGALFIKNGIIESVHRGDTGQTSLPPAAEVIDCGGNLIMPGFCDSHTHGVLGSFQSQSVDLTGCSSEEEAVKKTADFYKDSTLPRFVGFGWNHHNWIKNTLPERAAIDKVIKDKPVYLFNEELHSLWLNTAALKEAGIDDSTPQPENGRIFKDDKGEPTGYLLEPGAIELVSNIVFSLSPENKKAMLRNLIKTAAGCGITSFSDIQIYDTLDCEIYQQFLDKRELGSRIFPVFPMNEPIDKLIAYRNKYDSDFLRFSGVKEFLDGTAAMYTGTLVKAYSDRPGYNAPPLVDVGQTTSRAVELDRLGFRMRFHACGAGAVRLGLDIFEEVRKKNGPGGARHTIEHIENIAPIDIPRFKQLGVTASVQPDHLWSEKFETHPFHDILGPERCRWTWPFKSLSDSGADMAFGTDFPVSPLNPMQGIYRAITRLHEDGKPEGGWNPEEKLGLADSLNLYTAGSARAMYAEHSLGMLKSGMAADIAVIEGDLFEMSPDEIRDAKVQMTISDGKIVYRR